MFLKLRRLVGLGVSSPKKQAAWKELKSRKWDERETTQSPEHRDFLDKILKSCLVDFVVQVLQHVPRIVIAGEVVVHRRAILKQMLSACLKEEKQDFPEILAWKNHLLEEDYGLAAMIVINEDLRQAWEAQLKTSKEEKKEESQDEDEDKLDEVNPGPRDNRKEMTLVSLLVSRFGRKKKGFEIKFT